MVSLRKIFDAEHDNVARLPGLLNSVNGSLLVITTDSFRFHGRVGSLDPTGLRLGTSPSDPVYVIPLIIPVLNEGSKELNDVTIDYSNVRAVYQYI